MFFTNLAERMGLLDVLAPKKKRERKAGKTADARQQEQEQQQESPVQSRQIQLQSQKQREEQAEKRGTFVKMQRVKYHHRGRDRFYDAVIIGVHLDDGPEYPYYTIVYNKADVAVDEEGSESATFNEIEKQTTPDRLERVPWDEDASGILVDKKSER